MNDEEHRLVRGVLREQFDAIQLDAIFDIVRELAGEYDAEPCTFDHEAYCQTHYAGYAYTDDDRTQCRYLRAKLLVVNLRRRGFRL